MHFWSCWLSTSEGVIWAFIAPMIVIIIVSFYSNPLYTHVHLFYSQPIRSSSKINSVFLVIALVKVVLTKRKQAMKKKSTFNFDLFKWEKFLAMPKYNLWFKRVLFRATVALLPILGLTWIFGLFAVNQNTSWFAWLFTIFNTLQVRYR